MPSIIALEKNAVNHKALKLLQVLRRVSTENAAKNEHTEDHFFLCVCAAV